MEATDAGANALTAMLTLAHPTKVEASNWARSELAPIDGDRTFGTARWFAAAGFGVQGSCTPMTLGGSGASAVELMLLFEGLGHAGVDTGMAFALASHTVTVERSLVEFGSSAQHERWLPGVLSGHQIGSFAMTEPDSGSDPWSMHTIAVGDDRGFTLNGSKTWITLAPVADFAIVFARTDPDAGHWGVSAFVIDLTLDGVTRSESIGKAGLEASPWGSLEFVDVRLGPDTLLGTVGSGAAIFARIVEAERAFLYAPLLGASERIIERCVERARSRHQGGKPIGGHQAVAHRIVTMKQRHEAARLMLYKAAAVADQGGSLSMAASLAKLETAELGPRIALDAMSIFGAAGYAQEAELDTALCDAVGGLSFSATADIARNIVASELRLDRPVRTR